jgi:Uma2 family endonuclease
MSTVTEPKLKLENGDVLTKEEFLCRWEDTPEIRHAELLEGVVYVNSAAISTRHGRPQGIILRWLYEYESHTPNAEVFPPVTSILSDEDVPEPDAVMYIDHPKHGNCQIEEKGYLEGAPELVVEIAASSSSKDLHVKKRVYQKAGVKEYIVWRTVRPGFDWFVLKEGEYVSLMADPNDGYLKSCAFPGLWMDLEALLSMDKRKVIERMQASFNTSEHRDFVAKLSVK